jgi:uncharacterized protein YfbU (UPF0304 family)
MKLDQFQRTLLANQYRILAKLEPKEGNYEHQIEALEDGYETEYPLVDREVLDAGEARFVGDVLQLFRKLKMSFKETGPIEGVEESDLKFPGFDGNHPIEAKLWGYTQFLWKTKRFTESAHDGHDEGNSHMETMGLYKAMLAEAKGCGSPFSSEEILRIVRAR